MGLRPSLGRGAGREIRRIAGLVRTAARLVAGLIPLALLVIPWYIATGVRSNCHSAGGAPLAAGEPGCPGSIAYQVTHPTPWWGFNHVFGPILLLVLIAVPILVAIYFELKLVRRAG
jgi:hypothetical protein